MKIAVTGASGHVGTNLCRLLIDHGHEVKALIYRDIKGLELLPMEYIWGDVMVEDDLIPLCTGCECVINLAAYISLRKTDPVCWDVNVTGSKNLIRVARKTGVRRIIHFSSIHAFEQQPFDQILDESRDLCLDSPVSYNKSKAWGQKIMMESSANDLEIVVLNPTAIIGPNDYTPSLLGQALIRFYKGQNPGLIQGGYNWVDVRDVCMSAINALHAGAGGECYLIGGSWQSLKNVAAEIEKQGGYAVPKIEIPILVAQISAPILNLQAVMRKKTPLYTYVSLDTLKNSHRNISCEKAKTVLKSNFRPFHETIRDTMRWFQENNYV
jgi:dihydroflavonol-4-reductase